MHIKHCNIVAQLPPLVFHTCFVLMVTLEILLQGRAPDTNNSGLCHGQLVFQCFYRLYFRKIIRLSSWTILYMIIHHLMKHLHVAWTWQNNYHSRVIRFWWLALLIMIKMTILMKNSLRFSSLKLMLRV